MDMAFSLARAADDCLCHGNHRHKATIQECGHYVEWLGWEGKGVCLCIGDGGWMVMITQL